MPSSGRSGRMEEGAQSPSWCPTEQAPGPAPHVLRPLIAPACPQPWQHGPFTGSFVCFKILQRCNSTTYLILPVFKHCFIFSSFAL